MTNNTVDLTGTKWAASISAQYLRRLLALAPYTKLAELTAEQQAEVDAINAAHPVLDFITTPGLHPDLEANFIRECEQMADFLEQVGAKPQGQFRNISHWTVTVAE